MIAHQFALLQREVWEHRSIWMTPAVIALVITLGTLTGLLSISNYAEVVDMGIVGADPACQNGLVAGGHRLELSRNNRLFTQCIAKRLVRQQ